MAALSKKPLLDRVETPADLRNLSTSLAKPLAAVLAASGREAAGATLLARIQ